MGPAKSPGHGKHTQHRKFPLFHLVRSCHTPESVGWIERCHLYKTGCVIFTAHKKKYWHDYITMTFNSQLYWENRYASGANSGAGSYNHLADFKAQILNGWIMRQNVKTVIDYGVGDGHQLSLLHLNHLDSYIGIDVSPHIIASCREKFAMDTNKQFVVATELTGRDLTAELVLSCDVLYHLIEEEIFHGYIDHLFSMAKKYVIIYARDDDMEHTTHVKFRKFTDLIRNKYPNWVLVKHLANPYPQTRIGTDNERTSPSDFFFYTNFESQQTVLTEWRDYIQTKLLPIVHTQGEKLEGNIYSRHLTTDAATPLVSKQLNIVNLIRRIRPRTILEIGFNAGFSALLMQMASVQPVSMTLVDINVHSYVVPCFSMVSSDFSDMNIILEPSGDGLCRLIQQHQKYDLIHIDGDHSLAGARSDLDLCLQLCHDDTIIMFDDTNMETLNNLCSEYVRNGKLQDYDMPDWCDCSSYRHRFLKKTPTSPILISVTSIFQNQDILLKTLLSILSGQTKPPDQVHVYLSIEPFLLDQGFGECRITHPGISYLLSLFQNIFVHWVPNTGSYRKLLPLLKEKWETDCIIITIDDDTIYDSELIRNMVRDYNEHHCVVSYRGFTPANCSEPDASLPPSYADLQSISAFDYYSHVLPVSRSIRNFATGKAGVLYTPHFFAHTPHLVFNDDLYLDHCPGQDDIWFYVMRVLNRIECLLVQRPYMIHDMSRTGLFCVFNSKGNNNTNVLRNLVDVLVSTQPPL